MGADSATNAAKPRAQAKSTIPGTSRKPREERCADRRLMWPPSAGNPIVMRVRQEWLPWPIVHSFGLL